MNFLQFGKFFLLLLFFSFGLGLIALVPLLYFENGLIKQAVIYNLLFFCIITLITYPVLLHTMNKNPKSFMNLMLGSIFFKLVVSLIYLLLILYRFEEKTLAFVFTFFLSYILYTGFEIYLLLLNLRQISRKDKDAKVKIS